MKYNLFLLFIIVPLACSTPKKQVTVEIQFTTSKEKVTYDEDYTPGNTNWNLPIKEELPKPVIKVDPPEKVDTPKKKTVVRKPKPKSRNGATSRAAKWRGRR